MSNPSNDNTEVTTEAAQTPAATAAGDATRPTSIPRPAPRFGGERRFGGGAPRGPRPGGEGGENAPAGESGQGGGARRFGSGGPRRGGRPGGGRFGGRGRKVCQFCADNVRVVDYKDFNRLRHFMSERGKIEPRRKYGTCARHQRSLTTAIKRARFLALLPYVAAHTR